MPTLVCPECKKEVAYQQREDVPYRPFCSQRCKLIDLSKWLNEDYRVSEEVPNELQHPPTPPPESD